MVGIRIFLISILAFLLFSGPVYALRPSSTEDIDTLTEEAISSEAKEDIEQIKREKDALSESAVPIREERKRNLHPFVYKIEETEKDVSEEPSSDAKTVPARYVVKGFTPAVSRSDLSEPGPASGQGIASRPIANLIFFTVIGMAFLAGHFLIRPKSK